MSAAWIVEKRSREGLPPGFQHGLQGATIEMRTQPILEEVDNAGAGNSCVHSKVGSGADADDEGTGRVYLHDLAVAFELPGGHRAACESTAHARVV